MPFFVMIEIPKILIGSKVCWKGNIFWEQNDNNFLNLKMMSMIVSKFLKKILTKKFMVLVLVQVKLKRDLIIYMALNI